MGQRLGLPGLASAGGQFPHHELHWRGEPPFRFPTFAGPTLVNLGDAVFADLHSDEKTVIHELTHVCGYVVRAMNPDFRNHTGKPMDAQSPSYRYITGNVRVGHF